MRDIKFRGKRVDNSEWVYGNLADGIYMTGLGMPSIQETSKIGLSVFHLIDPSTVGQYTGLRDKDGVEIYEGDVCRVKEDGNEYDPGTLHQVKYWENDDYPAFDFEPSYDEDANGIQSAIFGSSVEVIGTIHEQDESSIIGES